MANEWLGSFRFFCVLLIGILSAEALGKTELPQTKNPYIPVIISLYDSLEFDAATSALQKASGWPNNTTEDLAWLELMDGVLQFGANKEDNALNAFKRGLTLNRNAQLPVRGSVKLRALFARAQKEMGIIEDKPEPPPMGTVIVRVTGGVTLAKLFVDGADRGEGATTPLPLPAGDHLIEVKRLGFRNFSKKIAIKDGMPVELPVTLVPVAGVLAVSVDAPDAEIWLDGKRIGTAPASGLEVAPGKHELEVRHEGMESDRSQLSIEAGKDYTVEAHLRPMPVPVRMPDAIARPTDLLPKAPPPASSLTVTDPVSGVTSSPPWYGRWYVWAGVGTVAAIAVTSTAVALSRPRSASPDDICGGPCDGVLTSSGALFRF